MEIEQAQECHKKNVTNKKKTGIKKLDSESVRLLLSLKDRANKKSFGRKVRDSEIIEMGLRLVKDEHLLELQEKTYSEKDRLNLAWADHCKKVGKISLEQFIAKLLKREI